MEPHPSRVATRILRAVLKGEDGTAFQGDLEERFRAVARELGPGSARRWYWAQVPGIVLWSVVPATDVVRRRSWAGLAGDVRSAFRTFRRSPLYAVGVAGTLGLGIAAATLASVVAWQVWLSPMPYPDPDRVIRLYEVEPAGDAATGPEASVESRRHLLSPPLLEDMRAHSWTTIDAVSAVLMTSWRSNLNGEIRTLSMFLFSPEGFGILGIAPTLGRLPSRVEDEVLLSERFWRGRFAADPEVIGSTLGTGRRALTVVGVARLPAGFPGEADVVGTIEWDEGERTRADLRAVRFVGAFARVAPGRSVAEAWAEANAFLAGLGEVHPAAHRGWTMEVVVLAEDLVRPFRGVLALLLAAGTTFLLLSAVNVLGLVAARCLAGRRDRSVRLALGASERRLLRGLITESVVLAGLGSGAGVLLASGLVGPMRALVPQDVPRLADVAVTLPFALGALSIGIVLGVLIGFGGYLASRGAMPSVGRVPEVRAAGGAVGRRAIVVGQVALTTLLAAGGTAILHRVSTLNAIELGFDPEGVWSTTLYDENGGAPERPVWREALAGIDARGIPAAVGFNTPLTGQERDLPPVPIRNVASETMFYLLHPVSPEYFAVMGIDVLAGRPFEPTDRPDAQNVVIVSEEFVRDYLPAGTPMERMVGRTLENVMLLPGPAIVVGIVRSIRHQGPDTPLVPELYIPFAKQRVALPHALFVRGDRERVRATVTAVVGQVDPALRTTPLDPYADHLKAWFAPLRLQVVLIGVLGGLGLLLASLGLYAVVAYQVAARRQELGIRKAVGATDGRLIRAVPAGGVATATLGMLVGLGAWYQLLPWSTRFLTGIDAAGSLVPLSVALVVGGSCLLATLLPALRTMRIEPATILKAD